MAERELNLFEIILFTLMSISIIASIVMCVCLFLVLPAYWTRIDYVQNVENQTNLIHECRCEVQLNESDAKSLYGRQDQAYYSRTEDQVEGTFSQNKIKAFPYVVSLSVLAYIDEPWEMRFACSGVIVAKSWVLTGGVCIIENSEYEYLKVRELSDYWSKGGKLHTVISASIKLKGQPIAVKIEHEFSAVSDLSNVPVKSIQNLMTVGWREPKTTRKKFEPFLVDLYTESKCWICIPGIIRDESSCDYMSAGKPLIANCNYLYGMNCKTKKGSVLKFLRLPEHRSGDWWLLTEDYASIQSKGKEIYGVIDMNVEQCRSLDFGMIFQEKGMSPEGGRTNLPKWLLP